MRLLGLVLVMAIGSAAHGGIKVVGQRDVKANLEEGLTVRFIEMKKEIVAPSVPDVTYHATDTRFVYSVPALSKIESYGIVQFIRGCVFESRIVNGAVEKTLSVSRDYFGPNPVTFQHKHWQIDNDTNDPMYSAYEGVSRFALLRWNDNPASFDADNAHYYQSKKPLKPTVFVTDLPAAGSFDSKFGAAKNTTLEFKTCIFKVEDLPVTTTPEGAGVELSKALWCVSWDNKYVWNFASKKIDRPTAIDPICNMDP